VHCDEDKNGVRKRLVEITDHLVDGSIDLSQRSRGRRRGL
jgi:hypothetical protein